MTNVHLILDKLDRVRRINDHRWVCCCPAHDDSTPSLAITEVDDRILIHCHASCSIESVLNAIGITFQDLYADPWRASYEAATALPLPKPRIDPLDHERTIVKLAAAQVSAGNPLNMEDEARVMLARERLGLEIHNVDSETA